MIYERYEELQTLVDEGLVTARKHDRFNLTIYNYSKTAKEVGAADPRWLGALGDARGLVLEGQVIVARGFHKFWNQGQVPVPENEGPPRVVEKMDGSLGIIFRYNNEVIVATRGSFYSPQAEWAGEWLRENRPDFMPAEGITFLVEIIYPENRIVVDYGDTKELVFLGMMSLDGQFDWAPGFDQEEKIFRRPKTFHYSSIINPTFQQNANEEGYVLYYPGGFMEKFKFDEYCLIHKLIFSVSSYSIWESLAGGPAELSNELLERVPWDVAEWILKKRMDIIINIEDSISDALIQYFRIITDTAAECFQLDEKHQRAIFAREAKQYKDPGLLFMINDKREPWPRAWKLNKPAYETPFRPAASEE